MNSYQCQKCGYVGSDFVDGQHGFICPGCSHVVGCLTVFKLRECPCGSGLEREEKITIKEVAK
jgi:hypothetical protein